MLHTLKKYSHVHMKMTGESPGVNAKKLILSKKLSQNPLKNKFFGPRSYNFLRYRYENK